MKNIILLILSLCLTINLASAEVYVTEEKVQIDRCACAWFITRFIDPKAEFVFFKNGEKAPEGIGFDYFGAEYFHKGPDCSFTAFIKKYPRKDKKQQEALIKINTLVNDVFSWQQGRNSKATKLRIKIDNIWNEKEKNDSATFEATKELFDALLLEYTQAPAK